MSHAVFCIVEMDTYHLFRILSQKLLVIYNAQIALDMRVSRIVPVCYVCAAELVQDNSYLILGLVNYIQVQQND